MRGIRFYREPNGNCIAIDTETPLLGDVAWGAAGLYDRPNSPVASTGVSRAYLRDECKRISEKRARELHPKLFEYLEVE